MKTRTNAHVGSCSPVVFIHYTQKHKRNNITPFSLRAQYKTNKHTHTPILSDNKSPNLIRLFPKTAQNCVFVCGIAIVKITSNNDNKKRKDKLLLCRKSKKQASASHSANDAPNPPYKLMTTLAKKS